MARCERSRGGSIARKCTVLLALAAACSTPGDAPPPVVRGYGPTNGLRMYHEVHGSGRPLVLLHGGGSTIRTTFGAVLHSLARDRQVIAIEQQGHGHTADIDRPLSFEQMADDTAALLAHLGVQHADVFGFSNGGNVALQLAIRHPRLVRRLVAGSVFWRNDGLQPAVRASFVRGATPADMPAVLREEYLAVAPDPTALPRLVDKLMAMLAGFRDWPEASLRGIGAPTLLLQGNDDVARLEHIAELSRLIPDCELAVLPGGHGTYLGEATAAEPGGVLPSLTVALVERFLGR